MGLLPVSWVMNPKREHNSAIASDVSDKAKNRRGGTSGRNWLIAITIDPKIESPPIVMAMGRGNPSDGLCSRPLEATRRSRAGTTAYTARIRISTALNGRGELGTGVILPREVRCNVRCLAIIKTPGGRREPSEGL